MDAEILTSASNLSREELHDLILKLNHAYHAEGQPLVEDQTFDSLIALYESKYGSLNLVGALPSTDRVKLPVYLPSLDKIMIREDESLTRAGFKSLDKLAKQFPGLFIITDKVDGISGLYTGNKLYTQGNGIIGRDVSHHLSVLHLPPIPYAKVIIRGELIMLTADYEKYKQSHPEAGHVRNVSSGIINSGSVRTDVPIHFIAYQIIAPLPIRPSDQIQYLRQWGFETPYAVRTETLTIPDLEAYLRLREREAPYKIDGLVISANFDQVTESGNPIQMAAFKVQPAGLITTVTSVTWSENKDRYLFPTVHFQELDLGAKINKASGKSAQFIIDNGIGPGAVIEVTRAGDVIPEILRIVKAVEPQYPPQDPSEYEWNELHSNFVLKEATEETKIKGLEYFVESLDIKDIGPGRLRTLSNFIDLDNAIAEMIQLPLETWIKIFGEKVGTKIYDNLQTRLQTVTLPEMMKASGIFGRNFGIRRTQDILNSIPDLLDRQPTLAEITGVEGIGEILGEQFLKQLPIFRTWLNSIPEIVISESSNTFTPDINIPQTLAGMTVVVSGFRSNAENKLNERIAQRGGIYTDTGPTKRDKEHTIFVYETGKAGNSKLEKVRGLGISEDRIMDRKTFESKFL